MREDREELEGSLRDIQGLGPDSLLRAAGQESHRPKRAEEGVLTNLAHVEGPVGPAAHSIQSRVHSAQGHQGWRICVQLELDSLPWTVLLAAVHFQLQLAEAGMGAVRLRRAFFSLLT